MKSYIENGRSHLGSLIIWAASVLLLAGCSGENSSSGVASGGVEADSGAPPTTKQIGEKIYGEYCFSCHGPGLNGAPKLGDEDTWAPRLAKGVDLMLQATIEGIPPAMPPRGLCMSCSDDELRAAVIYMSGAAE